MRGFPLSVFKWRPFSGIGFALLALFILTSFSGNDDDGIASRRSRPVRVTPSIFIIGRGVVPPARLVDFMCSNNTRIDSVYAVQLVKTYIRESHREGVNYEVAICQMCLETGFLRFNGSVSRFQNNFCGLGATDPYTAGDWFGSMEEGVRAHIQHLKAYASIEPITPPYADKRLVHVRRGTVFTIHDLTGRWAADPLYGEKIGRLLGKLYGSYEL
jgi:hypothetical protein